MEASKQLFIGPWRIIDTEIWEPDDLDLVEPATLELRKDGTGWIRFIAVAGSVDFEVSKRDGGPAIEFSWEGTDEGDSVSGRGWTILTGDRLDGRIYFHRGDSSSFRGPPRSVWRKAHTMSDHPCRTDRISPHCTGRAQARAGEFSSRSTSD